MPICDGFAKDYVGQMARLSRGPACGFLVGPAHHHRGEKKTPGKPGESSPRGNDSLGFLLAALLAALSGLLLLLTRLLAAATLLTTLLLTWLLLSTAALLTTLLLAGLLTTATLLAALAWILISHDLVSPAGKFPPRTTSIPQVRSSRKVIECIKTGERRTRGVGVGFAKL
jgi:cell division protein FtsW (lipid II flippase)